MQKKTAQLTFIFCAAIIRSLISQLLYSSLWWPSSSSDERRHKQSDNVFVRTFCVSCSRGDFANDDDRAGKKKFKLPWISSSRYTEDRICHGRRSLSVAGRMDRINSFSLASSLELEADHIHLFQMSRREILFPSTFFLSREFVSCQSFNVNNVYEAMIIVIVVFHRAMSYAHHIGIVKMRFGSFI